MFKKEEGAKVKVRGWVYRKREFGDKIFLVIRDSTGIVQSVVYDGAEAFKKASKAGIEASVEVTGIVKSDPRAVGGKEIRLEELKILGPYN